MWSANVEENQKRCEATGLPPRWRLVCAACGHRGPVFEGKPGSGGANAMHCCGAQRIHIHDLRIPCEGCAEDEEDRL